MAGALPTFDKDAVNRLWFHRQGLTRPRGETSLSKRALVGHLERTGALQLDSVNAVERAHYLTLWSRFGPYDRAKVDRWVYRDRAAYEHWGHEASILPISHLPIGRRAMKRFPPESWSGKSWWSRFATSTASKRRVLKRLREEGPLESVDFERQEAELGPGGRPTEGWLQKEDKRSLKLLWHDGRVAVTERRHFRCVYDMADRVYPDSDVASPAEYEDSWLLTALGGNGVAPERHMVNYFTGPALKAADRKRVIARNLKKGRVVEVRVKGLRGPCYALPEHLEKIDDLAPPSGTTLVCPFDSVLWQRKRAEELLGFKYTIEIYVPAEKRVFGYYVLPILHDGRLVGRIDPKLHRDRGVLEIKAIHTEPGFQSSMGFVAGFGGAVDSLAQFLGASDIEMPSGWMMQLG